MRYLVIETHLFFTDIPDEQLDHWFLGADCAGWFYARLLPYKAIRQHLNPTMEDWGWIMAVEANGIVVDICVRECLDLDKHWVLGVAGKKKFLKKTDPELIRSAEQAVEVALNAIVEADNRFLKAKWLDDNPMEKPIALLDLAPTNKTTDSEQAGTGQPATRPVDKPEGGDKPQPEAEGRSR